MCVSCHVATDEMPAFTGLASCRANDGAGEVIVQVRLGHIVFGLGLCVALTWCVGRDLVSFQWAGDRRCLSWPPYADWFLALSAVREGGRFGTHRFGKGGGVGGDAPSQVAGLHPRRCWHQHLQR
jgi:hypothetical protein